LRGCEAVTIPISAARGLVRAGVHEKRCDFAAMTRSDQAA
jgi:hypothetical protein